MALDGAFLYAICRELQPLVGCKIDKVFQPSREEVVLVFRSKSGTFRLLISASANSARMHITNSQPDNPKTPPMFCMLLRKRLGGGRLVEIRQNGLERIVYLVFACVTEIGEPATLTLAVEIMGRHSNIILLDEEQRIVNCIKRVDVDKSRTRPVIPGMRYTLPPAGSRLNLLTASDSEIREAISRSGGQLLTKALISTFEGISPIVAREWTFFATNADDVPSCELSQSQFERLCFAVANTRNALDSGFVHYTIVFSADNTPKDFSFIEPCQYGKTTKLTQFDTSSELLDYFYAERDSQLRLKQRAEDLLKLLASKTERIAKRISAQREELEGCKRKDELRLYAELLTASLYSVHRGDTTAVVSNYYADPPTNVEIPLDIKLSPSANAQKYFSEYKKLCTAEVKLAEQIELGEHELMYVESVFDALTRATTEDDVLLLRAELSEQGYVRTTANQRKQKPREMPPIEHRIGDFTVLVGRNNKQNDRLTLKIAQKQDIWLHTKDIPGAHVIIVTGGAEVPQDVIYSAARIAAQNSKACKSSQVPVDYCFARYVKKPPGAKPGMVIFTNNKTLYINDL